MKIHRSTGYIHIDLSSAEAMVLLDELENVRGGAKLVKLRQVCEGLQQAFVLETIMAPKKMGRPKSAKVVPITHNTHVLIGGRVRPISLTGEQSPFEIEMTPPWENRPREGEK